MNNILASKKNNFWQNLSLYSKANKLKYAEDTSAFEQLWQTFNIQSWNLALDEYGFVSIPHSLGTDRIHADSFLEHCYWLTLLQKVPGFEFTVESLKNPQQVLDTFFEVQWARKFYLQKNVTDFVLSPKVIVSNQTKRPDMGFLYLNEPIYVECKRMTTVNRALSSRQLRLMKAIQKEISSIIIPVHLRLEVFFTKLPSHYQKNLGVQLRAAVEVAIKSNHLAPITLSFSDINDSIQFCLRYRGSPIIFPAMMSVGSTNPHLKNSGEPKNSQLVVSANEGKIEKYIGKTLDDAITQLPPQHKSIICVETLTENTGAAAAKLKLANIKYKNVAGIIVGNNQFSFHVRTELSNALFNLLNIPSEKSSKQKPIAHVLSTKKQDKNRKN